MLFGLRKIFGGMRRPNCPSVVLTLQLIPMEWGIPNDTYILHVVPEYASIECFGVMTPDNPAVKHPKFKSFKASRFAFVRRKASIFDELEAKERWRE